MLEEINKPIRIAQMMTEMNYGGVEMVVMNYYRHIDHSRYQFDFFALEGSKVPQREEIERLGGHVYLVPKYTHLISYIKCVSKLLHENQYKIVHSHMNALSVFSLYAAKKAAVPIRIAHSHSTAAKGETKKNIVKNILRPFSCVFPTHCFACSEKAGKWLFGNKKAFNIINNAIDLPKFAYDEKVREKVRKELQIDDKFVVGYMGRLCYQKNPELAVEIFNSLHLQMPEAVLVMVGEGEYEQKIREKIRTLKLDDVVLLLGARNDPERLYQAMDTFVFPSRYEGLGMVLVESQVSNLPCFATKAVPKAAQILPCAQYIDNENDLSEWVDKIIKSKCNVRKNQVDIIANAGYDIHCEARKLMDRYDAMLDHVRK